MFNDLLRNLDLLHHWRDFLDGLFPNTDWSGIRHPVLRLRASIVPTLHFGTAFKQGLPKANARCCLMRMRGGFAAALRQCVRGDSGVWVAAVSVAAPAAVVASVAVASAALSAEAADAAQAIISSCAAEHVQVPCGCYLLLHLPRLVMFLCFIVGGGGGGRVVFYMTLLLLLSGFWS